MADPSHEIYKPDDYLLSHYRHISFAVAICCLLTCLHYLIMRKYDTFFVLLSITVFVPALYFKCHKSKPKLGMGIMVSTLSISACLLMWANEGLTDEVVFVFPCLIVFASFLNVYQLTLGMLLLFALNMFGIGYVNDAGLITHETNATSVDMAIDKTLVLTLFTFTVLLISKEVKALLNRLVAENQKVNDSKQEILRLHHHDPLTGLPNRIYAKAYFEKQTKRHSNTALEPMAMLFIDIDNFKSINDGLGHNAGDRYLIDISNRLKLVLGEKGQLFRFGGDEFVAIVQQDVTPTSIKALAGEMLTAVKRPLIVEGNVIQHSISIGIAITPEQGDNFDLLYLRSDIAMYSCKQRGRGMSRFYCDSLEVDHKRQSTLAKDIHNCVSGDQLRLVFQCEQQLEYDDVFGAEALLRWSHPELGMISPAEFIPIAEKSGTIIDIGLWVLEGAIKECAFWHQLGFNKITVSVNVSPLQLLREEFPDQLKELLEAYQLNGKWLVVEMTESILMDSSGDFLSSIKKMRECGVNIAIDDFGTGYSNLGYLQKIDASIIKIDQSFVLNMLESKNDLAIVTTIINMAKILGLRCIAEGIETAELRDKLTSLGVEIGQGYYWSKPLPPREFLEFLSASFGRDDIAL